MRALLDTHIALWWLSEPERLSKEQYNIISSKNSQILLSSASIWEIRIKESLGKLEVPSNILELIKEENIEMLSITAQHADHTRTLPPLHKDPFDRIIIAQAKLEGLVVLSSDNAFNGYEINLIN